MIHHAQNVTTKLFNTPLDLSCIFRCYYLHKFNLNKADAKAKCKEEGTSLAQLSEGTGEANNECGGTYGCEWDVVVKNWLAKEIKGMIRLLVLRI